MKTLFCVLSVVVLRTCQGILFGDPCDVSPSYDGAGIPSDSNYTTSVKVPHDCKNGTFRWDYPVGHTIVHFLNAKHVTTAVCIRDSLGGDIFTITDKTEGTVSKTLTGFTREKWLCMTPTAARDIVLQIDAPDTMYYMGEVEYRLDMAVNS